MRALFCTVQSVQRRLQILNQNPDPLLPLLQEVMNYQFMSAWPTRSIVAIAPTSEPASQQLRLAIDYIEANLPMELTLVEVAASASVSVRSLQIKFKKELGRTPVRFII